MCSQIEMGPSGRRGVNLRQILHHVNKSVTEAVDGGCRTTLQGCSLRAHLCECEALCSSQCSRRAFSELGECNALWSSQCSRTALTSSLQSVGEGNRTQRSSVLPQVARHTLWKTMISSLVYNSRRGPWNSDAFARFATRALLHSLSLSWCHDDAVS